MPLPEAAPAAERFAAAGVLWLADGFDGLFDEHAVNSRAQTANKTRLFLDVMPGT